MAQKYTVTIDEDGNRYWRQNDRRHRTDGPAYEGADGTRYWYQNDQLHRTDGPAIEYADGSRSWWLNGQRLTEEEHQARTQVKPTCAGRVIEVDGVKYRLTAL